MFHICLIAFDQPHLCRVMYSRADVRGHASVVHRIADLGESACQLQTLLDVLVAFHVGLRAFKIHFDKIGDNKKKNT